MNRKLRPMAVLAVLFISTLVWAQNQPLPKPVSPPSPNPGNTPPAGTNANSGGLAGTARGSVPTADSELAPFLDSQTLGIVRVDLKEMDLPAIREWVEQGVDDLRKTNKEVARARDDVRQELAKAFDRIDKFRSAGADRMYIVVSLADVTEDRAPFIVIPLRDFAEANAVEAALTDAFGFEGAPGGHSGPVARTLGKSVVFAEPATFDRLKAATPAQRPDLSIAFDAAGKAQIRLALIPQEGARKALESVVANLPEALGGGSIQSVSRGLSWASIAISMPPDPSLRIVIEGSDPAGAAKLNDVIAKAIGWAAERKTGPQEELAFTQLIAALKPQLDGPRITITLTPSDIRQLAATFAGGVIGARNNATRTVVMSHLRQLCMGVFMYAAEHQGTFPKDLGGELDKYLGPNSKQLWIDPLRPNEKKPYVYLKLANKMSDVKESSSAVMIYENHTTWDDGINVAFADGHVEWVADEKQFKAMLDLTKKNNPSAVEMPQ